MEASAQARDRDPVAAVVDLLRRAGPSIERIVLFGSRARGEAQPRSDIDLAISCPRASEREWAEICEALEESPTLLGVDLVRLEAAAESLRERILREGRIVYDRRADRTLR
jgi:predicted nucleotidyltransferase